MLDLYIHVWTGVLLCICSVVFLFSLVAAGLGLFGVNLFDRFEEYDGLAHQVLTVISLLVLSNLSLVAAVWLHPFVVRAAT